jgi:translation initiation factor IF-3
VRVIDSNGAQLGVMPTSQALGVAQQRGLDLVEVAPNATPPVCRVTDFGKYKYEQTKKERESRKHQHAGRVKEIKLRLNIDDHDYQTKLNHMRDFLAEGMKVKVSVFFRGREMAHTEYGEQLMQRVVKDLEGAGRAEAMPKLIGRSIHMLIGPARGATKTKQQEQQNNSENES